MDKENELTVRLYQNKTNSQYSLIPQSKRLSTELRRLLDSSTVAGLKLKIVKTLSKEELPLYTKKTPEERRAIDMAWKRKNPKRVKATAKRYRLKMKRLKG